MRGQSDAAYWRAKVEDAQLQLGLILSEVERMIAETAPTGATPSPVGHVNARWLLPRLQTARTLQAQALGYLNATVAEEYAKKETDREHQ